MQTKWWAPEASRTDRSLDVVRYAIALITTVHPVYRIYLGDVSGFGEFLQSIGWPMGVAVAWMVTLIQLFGGLALIVRRLIVPSCILNIFIFLVGIYTDHMAHGWFVVGAGTDGMEYSVTLIACLFAIIWAYWPRADRLSS